MSVGQVNYNAIDQYHRRVELDIWMSCEANCGRGYGPDALQTLCDYLFQKYGIVEFVIQPSARNHRAIRAYEIYLMNERILKKCGINMLSKTLVDLEKMENKEIPDDWVCPVCGASKAEFEELEE